MSDAPKDPASDVEQAAPSAPDERDETIARLERQLAAERQDSAALRKASDDLRFKGEVLEKGYTTQLAEARQRRDAAEQALAEHQAQIAALTAERDDVLEELADVRTELERLTAAVEQPDRSVAANMILRARAKAKGTAGAEDHENSLTINELIEDARWLRERKALDEDDRAQQVEAEADDESSSEDMLAPDFLFAANSRDED